jgi:hypothetical protein
MDHYRNGKGENGKEREQDRRKSLPILQRIMPLKY